MRHQTPYQKRSKAKSVAIPAAKENGLFIGISIFALFLLVVSNGFAATGNSNVIHPAVFQDKDISRQGIYFNQQLHGNKYQLAMAAYERGEYHLARRMLLPLAKSNHTKAQFYMGMLYDMGLGVAANANIAVYWYKKAAEKGNQHAQHNLAVAYANGDGIAHNMHHALIWWKRAAKQGNTDSQYNLGIIYATGNKQVQQDLLKAEKWWRMAAISGDAMAQYNLGTLYANGEEKVTSYCEAIRWWQQSAQGGMSQALVAIEVLKQRPDYRPC